jgi:hypothetical protein
MTIDDRRKGYVDRRRSESFSVQMRDIRRNDERRCWQ